MPKNIENIVLGERIGEKPRPVKIRFKFPCTWTILDIDDLMKILRLWIKGEEEKYPLSQGYEGRWMIYNKIKEVFNEK